MGLAKSLYRLDRRPEAREEFSRVLEREPQNEEALYYMGLIASAEGDYASALAFFKETIELYPMNPGALFNAGQMLVRLEDPEQARVCFTRHRQAIEKLNQIYPLKLAARRPGATSATWMKLGNAYLQAGMQTQALDAFQAARRLGQDPAGSDGLGAPPSALLPGTGRGSSPPVPSDQSTVSFELGLQHREAGRLTDAIEVFRTVSEADPGSSDPLVAMAEIQMLTESWEDALATAKSITRRFPALVRGHFLRASCLAELGRFPGARKWVERALSIDPAQEAALKLRDRIDRQLARRRKNHE